MAKKETILNIPNPITMSRIILSIVLVYIVIKGASLWTIAIVFAIAALTDALDGFLARKLNMVTNFGRKWDIIADRILMVSIIIALIIYLIVRSQLTSQRLIFMLLIMSREIISAPFLVISLFRENGKPIPHVRTIGKITTTFQGITFPLIVLGWDIACYFVVMAFVSGIVSGIYYAYDSVIKPDNIYQKEWEREYRVR